MHGRKKLQRDAEERRRIEKHYSELAGHYRSSMDTLKLSLRNECSEETILSSTVDVLKISPNVKHVWNLRKNALLKLKESLSPECFDALCKEELLFAQEICLPVDHKSYSTWFQMIYVLQQMHSPDFTVQLKLTEKFLNLDERNFHCWNYRRFILTRIPNHHESELVFTEKLLRKNQNNFSAWHQRSCILKDYLQELHERDLNEFERKVKYELNLVTNALYTNPDEESCWLYLKWLFSRGSTTKDKIIFISFHKLNDDTGELIISLSKATTEPCYKIAFRIDGREQEITPKWISCGGSCCSITWFCKLDSLPPRAKYSIRIFEGNFENISIRVDCECFYVNLLDRAITNMIKLDYCVFNKEFKAICELLDMELQNINAIRMQIDFLLSYRNQDAIEEICSLYEKLSKIDFKRRMYYETMKSETLFNNALLGLPKTGSWNFDFNSPFGMDFPNKNHFVIEHFNRAKKNINISKLNFGKRIPACVFHDILEPD